MLFFSGVHRAAGPQFRKALTELTICSVRASLIVSLGVTQCPENGDLIEEVLEVRGGPVDQTKPVKTQCSEPGWLSL